MVAAAFGLGGGQRRPELRYQGGPAGLRQCGAAPRVLFDEAHHNFHTAGGRYKPFAELIANDGYQVIPSTEKFSREVLQKGDVLVIANALGGEGMGLPESSKPAFTDAECDAVRDWLEAGGHLLFITDHAPFGAAAEGLAKRLGVDLSKGATSDPRTRSGVIRSWSTRARTNSWAITRSLEGATTLSGSTASRRSPARRSRARMGVFPFSSWPTRCDLSYNRNDNDAKPVSAAGRAQGIAFRLGKGRVVVLGEAAELSAQVLGLEGEKFGMNVPGLDNRQMALNIMHWLSGLLEPENGSP